MTDTLQHILEQFPEKSPTVELLMEDDSEFLALFEGIVVLGQVQRLIGFLFAVKFYTRANPTARQEPDPWR